MDLVLFHEGNKKLVFIMKVRRGNYGERYSGGIGAQSALGVGYGGTNVAGSHFSGVSGPQVVFDSLALKTVSVPNNAFVSSYQVKSFWRNLVVLDAVHALEL